MHHLRKITQCEVEEEVAEEEDEDEDKNEGKEEQEEEEEKEEGRRKIDRFPIFCSDYTFLHFIKCGLCFFDPPPLQPK